MKRKDCLKAVLLLNLFLFLMVNQPLRSQNWAGSYSNRLGEKDIDELLGELSGGKTLNSARKLFFGSAYDKELADLVFFIDETRMNNDPDYKPRIELIKGNQRVRNLFGERFLYVVSFIAAKPGERDGSVIYKKASPKKAFGHKIASASASEYVAVHLSPLDQIAETGEFALFSVFQTILSGLSTDLLHGKDKTESCVAVSRTTEVFKLGTSRDSTDLYLAMTSLPLSVNTINRVRLGQTGDQWIYEATFGNYSGSMLTSSVGVLATVCDKKYNPVDSVKVTNPAFSPFLFVHLYLGDRPLNPKPRYNNEIEEYCAKLSFSGVLGARLSNDFTKEIFGGICIGHVVSKLGLIVGVNSREIEYQDGKKGENKPKRENHWSFGVSYIF